MPRKIERNQSDEIKKENTKSKAISKLKEIKEECFIIGAAIQSGIPLRLKRKEKSKNKKLQRFIIEEVYDTEIARKIDNEYYQWENKIDELSEMNSNTCVTNGMKKKYDILKRDRDQCKQNIIYMKLLEYMEENNQQINYMGTRGADKIIKRNRISTFNCHTQYEIHTIGEKIAEYLLNEMEITDGKKRNECEKRINSLPDSISIPLRKVPINQPNPYQLSTLQFIEQPQIFQQLSQQPIPMNYFDQSMQYLSNQTHIDTILIPVINSSNQIQHYQSHQEPICLTSIILKKERTLQTNETINTISTLQQTNTNQNTSWNQNVENNENVDEIERFENHENIQNIQNIQKQPEQ